MRTLRELRDAINEAEGVYESALAKKLVRGLKVHVVHGERWTAAEVIYTHGDRVKLQSTTGKQYSIHATRLAEHDDL